MLLPGERDIRDIFPDKCLSKPLLQQPATAVAWQRPRITAVVQRSSLAGHVEWTSIAPQRVCDAGAAAVEPESS